MIIGISNGMVAVLLVLIVAGYTAYTHPHTAYRPLNEIILPVIVALLVVGIIETIEGLIVGFIAIWVVPFHSVDII